MIYKLIGTFGVGYIPGAPGTYGSLIGVGIYYLAFRYTGEIPTLILTFIIFLVGIPVADTLNKVWKEDDGRIVIDEVAGQMVALLFHYPSLFILITGFILFRLFDITKPLFIKKMEKIKGGTGVMMDDLVSGVIVNLLLWGIVWLRQLL